MEQTYNIFIIDDEVLVTSSLKALLNLEGYDDVFAFNNPSEALIALKDIKPDVIVSDFIMPEMNGLQFLAEAKKLHPDTSMMLLTGYADKENAIRAINEVGLYKYIEKPWDNDDLIINIKNAIERSHLVGDLKEKIIQLEAANKKLHVYSTSLEDLVAQRTLDLKESNSKLNAVISNCADGIIIFSRSGHVTSVNPACEDLFGLSDFLLYSKTIRELFVSEKEIDFSSVLSKKEDQLLRDLYLINFVNESRLPIEFSFACIQADVPAEDRYVCVIRDVSVQKEMERLRDDFIATLTHDLRTPLLAAIQTLQFFLDGSLGALEDKQTLLLQTMRKSNQDMLGLVNALLEVYKYESGKLHLVKSIFSVNDLIDRCCDEVMPLILNKQMVLNKDLASTLDIEISADKNELRRVIMNFLGNAISYTQEGGQIDVKATSQGSDVIFSVKDNGIGIDKLDVPKLFKRFSQGTTQKRSASTGLGLYLSKQIIEAHGGKIWLESDKGKGSEFSFLLLDSVIVKDRV